MSTTDYFPTHSYTSLPKSRKILVGIDLSKNFDLIYYKNKIWMIYYGEYYSSLDNATKINNIFTLFKSNEVTD